MDERIVDSRTPRSNRYARVVIGEGALEFEVLIPVEFGVARTDLVPSVKSVLAQIVEMDDAARAEERTFDDDEALAAVTVQEFFVEFRYFSATVNSQWAEYFTPEPDGRWRHRGMALPWMRDWRTKATPAILAVDAAYAENASAAAGVYIADWPSGAALDAFSTRIEEKPVAYEPGAFYKRELPTLMALLDQAPIPVSTIVVDSYVWLSGDGKPGLGARLYEALARRVPVVGVAKTRFHDDTWSEPVLRGASEAPLYVTAAGVDRTDAARNIARMSGAGRMPALLKQADDLARKALT